MTEQAKAQDGRQRNVRARATDTHEAGKAQDARPHVAPHTREDGKAQDVPAYVALVHAQEGGQGLGGSQPANRPPALVAGAPDGPEILQRAHTRDPEVVLGAESASSFPAPLPSMETLRYRPVSRPGWCPAITKAGTRCGRTVVLGNGRCRSAGHGGENSPEDIAALLAVFRARAPALVLAADLALQKARRR